ncbi:FMN-binding protein [Myceligenerans crystallogenes]|uniref:FMN-binding domain-containing protein n=1 Tax=Myceligenerans crystallogenes TaxID=316335 RepID=A0ABP4ZSU0_9MICO
MSSRWRGTLVYVGSLAVIGTAAFARYELSQTDDDAAQHAAGHHAGHSMSPSGEPSGKADGKKAASSPKPSSGEGSGGGSGAGGGSGTTTAPDEQDQPVPEPEPEPEEVTVTGAVIDTREGHVQVAVTFLGDEIIDVSPLQAGHGDDPRSQQINGDALPVLEERALAAQSARFDSVTGATYTSEGYKASLQSTIDLRG